MSGFLFMGEQEDPEMDTIISRGGVRIYGLEAVGPCIAPTNGDACFETQSDGCLKHGCKWPDCVCRDTAEAKP